ncbi:MAG: trimeric autotransporter adhesin, partial [Verrucomicrobiota bacterium]
MRTTLAPFWIAASILAAGNYRAFAPVGGTVVGGPANATISGSGTPLTIIKQNASHAIINWQDFSIGVGEITRFIQPSATATVLNRVIAGNPSLIYGSLQANGRVFVVNPNGILVGASGQIDTKGFVASTLDIPNGAFASKSILTLSGNSTAGVRNEGSIQALGGNVFLIGNTVENAGTIRAPQGTVGMAAGSEVRLVQSGSEHLSVLAGNKSGLSAANGVNNAGTVEAASAELKAAGGNIYALAINNGGVVRATSVVNEGGKIYLRANGGNIQNSGTLAANKADGSGGTIVVDGGHNAAAPSTVVNSGTIAARGEGTSAKGGTVELLGDQVALHGSAVVDASGDAGGGTALIGGDQRGKNATIQNAQTTIVDADVNIRADAIHSGDAGKIVVWADGVTLFNGTIYARALGSAGRGGSAEISGKQHLLVTGHAYVGGANGQKGQILIDPGSVDINHEPGGNTPPSANLDVFFDDWIVGQLNGGGGDLTISTANSLNAGTEDLTVHNLANISWNSANSLFLIGNHSLVTLVGSTIANLGSGGLSLQSGSGLIKLGGTVSMAGNVNVTASGAVTFNNNVTAASLTSRSGTSGTGDSGFGAGVTIQADTQNYRAGDGPGAITTAVVDLKNNNPT